MPFSGTFCCQFPSKGFLSLKKKMLFLFGQTDSPAVIQPLYSSSLQEAVVCWLPITGEKSWSDQSSVAKYLFSRISFLSEQRYSWNSRGREDIAFCRTDFTASKYPFVWEEPLLFFSQLIYQWEKLQLFKWPIVRNSCCSDICSLNRIHCFYGGIRAS